MNIKEEWLENLIEQTKKVAEAYKHVYVDDTSNAGDFHSQFTQLLEYILEKGGDINDK